MTHTLPIWLGPVCAFLVTALALVFLARLGPALGLMDHPGGRKDHASPTPVVGGIAIMLSVLSTAALLRLELPVLSLLVCAMLVFLAGLLDDMREISQWPRFAAQVLACVLVLWLADTPLRSVGNLFGFGSIGLWVFALPMTVFAIVGVINAVNMSDGLDGLAGSQCLIAALAYAMVAAHTGLAGQLNMLLILAGGLAAFLLFNMRFPWQSRAKVFMGDAGSMTLGFLLGWTAIELTQGQGRSFPPICALWIIVIPLCDTVSLILRRRAAGRSPFNPDREHLHHQLLARGFTVSQTVALLATGGLLTSLIGVGGWRLGVPEPILFLLFVALFVAHHQSSKRFWKQFRGTVPTTGLYESAGQDLAR